MRSFSLRLVVCVLLVVVLGVSLVGCGTQLTYKQEIGAAGARTMTLVVEFDDTATEQEKQAAWDLLDKIHQERYDAGRSITLKEVEDTYYLEESYASATDYYIAMGITGNEPNDGEETPHVDMGYFVEYRADIALASKATVAGYALRYAVEEQESVLFGWKQRVQERAEASETGVWRTLAAMPTDRLLAETLRVLSSDDELTESVVDYLQEEGFDLAQVAFDYTYSHVYKTVYAKEYDEKLENKDGSVVYVWHLKVADVPDKTVTIYQKSPRVWVWEATAIAVGVAVAIGVGIAILTRRKKNVPTKQNGQEEQV